MLKIEQWVKEHHGITLTPKQLEIIATLASGNKLTIITHDPRQIGKTTAYKAAIAYLQDGLTTVDEQSILADLNDITPDWQHAKLTRQGYIEQRFATIVKIKDYIVRGKK